MMKTGYTIFSDNENTNFSPKCCSGSNNWMNRIETSALANRAVIIFMTDMYTTRQSLASYFRIYRVEMKSLIKKWALKMGFRGNTRIGQLSRPHRCWWQNDRQLLVDEDFDRFCQHYWRRAPIFKRCHQYWNSVTNIYVTKWIISGIFMTTEFEIKKIALENPSQQPAMWGTRC